MPGFFDKLFGKPARAGRPMIDLEPTPPRRPNPQGIGARKSLAKITAERLAFGKKEGRYLLFEPRPDAGTGRLLGCGPTLNVDGTPMVGNSGYDERGKPYGVTENGVTENSG